MSIITTIINGLKPNPSSGLGGANEGYIQGFQDDIIDGVTGGVANKAGGQCLVTQNSPLGMSVLVANGVVYVPNADYIANLASTTKYYRVVIKDEDPVTIPSNSSGSDCQHGLDVVIDKVEVPNEYASNVATLVLTLGTPGAGAPAVPDNGYRLAEVEVADGATQIANVSITDTRAQITINDVLQSTNIVTKTGTQTLTNKTLTSPVIVTSTDNLITTTGSANTYLATPTTALGAYVSGLRLRIKINATNTNASTINVSSLGAKNILRSDGTALIGNELITNGIYDLVYDGTSFIAINIPHYQPKCSVTKTGAQSISNATFTTLTFETELFDDGAMHDNVTNNTRITIPTGYNGKYLVNASIAWASAFGVGSPYAPVRIIIILHKNGVSLRELYDSDYGSVGSTDPTMAQMTAVVPMVGGDYLELQVYQNSGVSKNISSSTIFECAKLI